MSTAGEHTRSKPGFRKPVNQVSVRRIRQQLNKEQNDGDQ
jgi:hypothetical protein